MYRWLLRQTSEMDEGTTVKYDVTVQLGPPKLYGPATASAAASWKRRNVLAGWFAGVLFHQRVPQTTFAPPLSNTLDVYFPALRYAAPRVHVSPSWVVPVVPPNRTRTPSAGSDANAMYWRGGGFWIVGTVCQLPAAVYAHVSCKVAPPDPAPPNRMTDDVAGWNVIPWPARADGPGAPIWAHDRAAKLYSHVSAKGVVNCEPPNRTSRSRASWEATAKPLRIGDGPAAFWF